MTKRKPNSDPVLHDGDYVADDGLWVSCRGIAIRISPSGGAVRVSAYRDGDEMGETLFAEVVRPC